MQDLLEWFEYYLQERGPQPGQWIEVQDNYGDWRIESRYPPADTTEWFASLGGELSNVGGSLTIIPDASSGPVWETEPLTETLRVVGTPRLHVDVTTATVGGQICMRYWKIVSRVHAYTLAMPSWTYGTTRVGTIFRHGFQSLRQSMRRWNLCRWMP